MPTLSTFAAETSTHGVDITLQVQQPGTGTYINIAELYQLDWDEDEMLVDTPVFGTRRTSARQGRFKVTGTATGYYINGALRAMWQGQNAPSSAGVTSSVYHSQDAFRRYLIQVTSTNTNTPLYIFYNVTLGKDAMKAASDKLVDETITFQAEDVFAY